MKQQFTENQLKHKKKVRVFTSTPFNTGIRDATTHRSELKAKQKIFGKKINIRELEPRCRQST